MKYYGYMMKLILCIIIFLLGKDISDTFISGWYSLIAYFFLEGLLSRIGVFNEEESDE